MDLRLFKNKKKKRVSRKRKNYSLDGTEISFRIKVGEETYKRIYEVKKRDGITLTHMAVRALEIYLDILDEKAHVEYFDDVVRDRKHA